MNKDADADVLEFLRRDYGAEDLVHFAAMYDELKLEIASLTAERDALKEERLKDQYEARPFARQPDAHIKHTEHWLKANEKHPQDVRWSLYPIGMVGTWIERAERAESALREATQDRCGNCDHHSELHNIHGCTVRIQLEDGKTMVDCPCGWDNLQASSVKAEDGTQPEGK